MIFTLKTINPVEYHNFPTISMDRNYRTKKAKVSRAKEVTWAKDKAIFAPREREVPVPKGASHNPNTSQQLLPDDPREWQQDYYTSAEPAPEAIEAMLAAANVQNGGKVRMVKNTINQIADI